MDYLTIAEDFYTIQGEGFSTGVPAYFVRLKDCNLTCGASVKKVKEVKDSGEGNTESGSFMGDLHESNEATWTCDTIPVWVFGHKKPFSYLLNKWDESKLIGDISSGLIHVIWTGGEPTLPRNQKSIVSFDKSFNDYCKMNDLYFNPFYEIETNGTCVIQDDLLLKLNQINCSAKLANSGMTKEQRIVADAIESIKSHPFHTFKFVISTEEDLIEAFDTFINPFKISLHNVCIMPGLDDQDNFHERTLFSMEMAKKYRVRGLTRLHVSAWDKTTGV
jgi:organic radical activating enzyme